MKFVDLTCSHCGAKLKVDYARKTLICEFCGSQILIDDGLQHSNKEGIDPKYYEMKKMADYCLENGGYDDAFEWYQQIFNQYRWVDYDNVVKMIKAYSHNCSFEYLKDKIVNQDKKNKGIEKGDESHLMLSAEEKTKAFEGELLNIREWASWIPQKADGQDVIKVRDFVQELTFYIRKCSENWKTEEIRKDNSDRENRRIVEKKRLIYLFIPSMLCLILAIAVFVWAKNDYKYFSLFFIIAIVLLLSAVSSQHRR